MQATFREFEDWLEYSVPDAVKIAYDKALAKLEECLAHEDTLVINVHCTVTALFIGFIKTFLIRTSLFKRISYESVIINNFYY